MDESREWDAFHQMDMDIPESLKPDIDFNDLNDICEFLKK